jgi:2-polyprenyl-3-methyl-5-hydroxy-6-metoxy-1,4-benzoquinol methylase
MIDRRCQICRSDARSLVAAFDQRPDGETDFHFAAYHRELWRCDTCGHFQNHHSFDLSQLYQGAYSQATYGERLRANFEKIMALPPDRSDNRQRAAYIDEFWRLNAGCRERDLVDVGSGLGVFPAAMRERGWRCLAVDPDPAAARQARELAGAEAMAGDFFALDPPRRFALVTFNKVLEHVPDMVAMLDRAKRWLTDDGLIYVELPDGEAAITDPLGAAREEFFVEHYCAFSAGSYALLARQAGLTIHRIDRIREPSGKYTLRGFMGGA